MQRGGVAQGDVDREFACKVPLGEQIQSQTLHFPYTCDYRQLLFVILPWIQIKIEKVFFEMGPVILRMFNKC